MSNPSKPSWTGACLQGNLRLLSPRLFAMGRGWRRGPSSHGQSATATRSTEHTYRWLGSCGLLQFSDPRSWFGALFSRRSHTIPLNSPKRHFFSTSARAQPSWVGPRMHCWGGGAVVKRHRRCCVTQQNVNTHVYFTETTVVVLL